MKHPSLTVRCRSGILTAVAATCLALSVTACSSETTTGPRLLGPYVLKTVNGQPVPMTGTVILSSADTVQYSVHSGTLRLDPSRIFTVQLRATRDIGRSTVRDIAIPRAGLFTKASSELSFFAGDSVHAAMVGSVSGDTLTLRNAFLGLDAVFVRHPL